MQHDGLLRIAKHFLAPDGDELLARDFIGQARRGELDLGVRVFFAIEVIPILGMMKVSAEFLERVQCCLEFVRVVAGPNRMADHFFF